MNEIDKSVEKMLLKKALGYVVDEVVEEYSEDKADGGLKLTKRKITTKHVPPDVQAGKILLELNRTEENDWAAFSDEQLENEKMRLLNLLKNYETEDSEHGEM